MKKLADKKILLVFITGALVFLLILIILVSLSVNKKKAAVGGSILSPTTSFDRGSLIIPTQKTEKKEEIDYGLITSKIIDYIDTQKNNSFFYLSNNQKDISYQADSYLASAYFNLYQKKKDSQYISQTINLSDSLKSHCQEKKDYQKDCYFVLEPYFDLYNFNKHPRYLEFIKENLSQLENYSPKSFNAYVHLSKQYLSYYLINFEDIYYQKALAAYQKALNLLPENQNNIGLLLQNQQMFYQVTNDDSWLKTSDNFFNQMEDSLYQKMNATQKLFVLGALQNLSSYESLYDKLLSEFIGSHLNKDQGFVCVQSSDCGENGLSLIIDNVLFINLLNHE